MADLKISQLSSATTPLAGTETLPIVQSGSTVKVAVSNLTAGRAVSASSVTTTGNVLVGTSTASAQLYAVQATSGSDTFWAENSAGNNVSRLKCASGSANFIDSYAAASDGTLIFRTASNERMRITNAGYFKATSNGSYQAIAGTTNEFYQAADDDSLTVSAVNASFTGRALLIRGTRDTTNSSWYFIGCYNNTASAFKMYVADSGNITNANGSYGQISDAKMKTDIVDAGSQWADIKAVRFRKFKMKNDSAGVVQLGVVAQELEQTSPGLIEEHADKDADGNDLGTTTKSVKTSVLLMKAAAALQEAMFRIEHLEQKVALLENK